MKHKAGLRTGRRQFLKSMAGMAVAAPLVIPGSALGADGRVSANERIVLGHIGMGCTMCSTASPTWRCSAP